ncbi:hypothetical protein UAW_01945 [Enterococcus haemoperoxidus ATCC BAA-382]|uniref:Lipoprotein n=1 Tax=Enterococcus haemoperoxidus ATCC BAA-382 TaxID=1158608 RepID=R2QLJ0_9ENTE|nr:hypothetical protein [Enterococcus haemoperoxidus]EOH96088.1 hypothetical protein UAW_01945 [Enterococcus haemoperoxidus ATCC BAA-382]EOT60276.1 hypothetical protein I583_02911 [Enterococcus haemoperoxidus ATCC BAA-382]
MKKLKLGMVCLFMGVLIFSGCGQTNNKSNSASTDTNSQEESSELSTNESVEKTSESKSSNSSGLKLMIEAAQSQIPSLKKQYEGMYSDISITEGEDSTIVYTYTFAQEPVANIDTEALKPTLVKGLKPVIDGAKTVVPDVKIQVIFLNPDKSEVINFVITQADTDSIESDTQ